MFKYFLALIILILCSCEPKFPERIGFYQIDYDGNSYVILMNENNTILINEHITDYVYNDAFILVEQQPIDSICECNPDCFERMDSYDGKSYKRCNEAVDNNKVRKYWIVKQINDTLSTYGDEKRLEKMEEYTFGPFTYNEYLNKRNGLRISKELKLQVERNNTPQQGI